MSSILTNTGAMVALQTLKSINTNLNKTQAEISTGKSVGSAKDNAATWAISKVMESDVSGFQGISESLSLGLATVAVARQASESVTELLKEIKQKIVGAQGENVDRGKIQTDIAGLRDQISSVVEAAQFNGLNLVNGINTEMNILSSLDRSGSSDVKAAQITVNGQNLSLGEYVGKAVFNGTTGASTQGDTAAFFLDAGDTADLVIDPAVVFEAGDRVSISIAGKSVSYTVREQDLAAGASTADLVAVGLKQAIDALNIADLEVSYDSGTPGTLSLTNNTANDMTVNASFLNAGSGALGMLNTIDVTTAGGAANALTEIEALIQTGIDASAAFGSAEKQLDIQKDFVSKLTDALRTGIGALVDADMEEVSARLQALQVQQQLGIQALSIANQAPQSVLALFR
ncbi:flagellin [Halodurantibacterium flavum]|uniref:Flagellin n=1 Tax=Halodurantibacterium flavum TaxID=1382802 RepID=A0ABW4S9B9_9RHOB